MRKKLQNFSKRKQMKYEISFHVENKEIFKNFKIFNFGGLVEEVYYRKLNVLIHCGMLRKRREKTVNSLASSTSYIQKCQCFVPKCQFFGRFFLIGITKKAEN